MRTPDPIPDLAAGVTLLKAPDRPVGPLGTLVLDHLLGAGGRARWVDAAGHAAAAHLAELAPEERLLERIDVARGFTAYQHQALLRAAVEDAGEETLLVAPAIDAPYREDVRGAEPRAMLLRGVARLARAAREAERPVLLSRATEDGLSAPLERVADTILVLERTTFGPRFRSEASQTMVYPGDGSTAQTTLAYWTALLRARQSAHESAAAPTTAVNA